MAEDSFTPNSDFSGALITGRGNQMWLPPAFPHELLNTLNASMIGEWTQRQQLYAYYWAWFDGRIVQAVDPESKAPLYPLQMNPLEWVCLMHTGALFGEIPDEDSENLVEFSFQNAEGKKDDSCIAAKRIVDTVWEESNASEIQLESGLISQVCGGSVFKVALVPGALRTYPIAIGTILPEYFFPVWDSEDKTNLLEAYELRYITQEEALVKYGVVPDITSQTLVTYLEHWTRDAYRITVNGKVPTKIYEDVEMPMEGVNPWGFVPYVYTPHLSRAGGYYGISHVTPDVTAMTEELNSRMADRGDKVKAQAIDQYWMRNSNTGIKIRTPSAGVQIYDVGTNMQQGKEPDMKLMERSSITATGGKEYTDDLWRYIGHATSTPSVAYGEDEGSQRSGMTLEIRFWPLTNHTRRERVMWTRTFARINRMILSMLSTLGAYGVDKSALTLKPKTEWNEILPRDRMDKVNEIVARAGVELISKRNAVTKLAQGEDVEQELAYMQADQEAVAELEIKKIKAHPAPAVGQKAPGGAEKPSSEPPSDSERSVDA